MDEPIIMTEEYWKNSIFSIARLYGGCIINNAPYKIVNQKGITVEELSNPKSKYHVRGKKAIPPGEPCDLIKEDWIPVYQHFGRRKTFEFINNNRSLKELLKEIQK